MAADRIFELLEMGVPIGQIHVAWLGDHIEGFNSQGGANAWRTKLTLTEQLRLTRRVMLHALHTLGPIAARMTMVAVPGNHGEPQRFEGRGVTRFDDSHDTEALLCVSEVAAEAPEKWSHVEFYVPENDELTVVLDVGGLYVLHAHGHQFSPNKHFEWWRGQSFHEDAAHASSLMLTGHLHHHHTEREGDRLWIGNGALEAESTYFRQTKGSPGRPGITGILIQDGEVVSMDMIEVRK